tara:strand:- start:120 stop:632 length:513 start_codon:yes stop_codon:yes gene_type:complete
MTSIYQIARSIPTANSFPIERPAAPHNSHQAAEKLIENIKEFSKLQVKSWFQDIPMYPHNDIPNYLIVRAKYDHYNKISIRINNFFPGCTTPPNTYQNMLFKEISNHIKEILKGEKVFKQLKIDKDRGRIYIYIIQPAEESCVQDAVLAPVNPHNQRPRHKCLKKLCVIS